MIALATNVISELMRPEPDEGVTVWLAPQDPLALATTCITVAEIRRGIVRLPEGKRRRGLEERFSVFVQEAFPGRLLPFDREAARAHGDVSAARAQPGVHADPMDMMIAAVVRTADATLATRNTSDFHGCGISLIDPWQRDR